MDLFAEPAFRADPEAVAQQQHADDQFGVNRRSAYLAVDGPQMRDRDAKRKRCRDGWE
jgi:hypothetical protein